jgi:hypothetical protein
VRRGAVRGGLALLATLHLTWGIPATLAPRWFFDSFPLGRHWTAAYPPYNEHLMVDVGAAFLTLGVLLALAAALMDRRVTTVVLLGVLVFSTVHLAFHLLRHALLTGVDLVASLVALALGVALPAALLLLVHMRRSEAPAA